jgi:UDP-N-acetylmuramoyl-tripeptide--D-alanyl-D-alanine ligase
VLEYNVEEVARAVGGRLIVTGAAALVRGVSIDSRTLRPGDLFFALPGERCDGHRFLGQAIEAGAAAAVVSLERLNGLPSVGPPLIHVQDVLRALGDLAAYHRSRYGVRVIGVTGSVGKTSTKDLIASVLAQKYRVLRSPGNWNNEIGVPLTLFRLGPETEIAVIELGMRGPGQIRRLAQIARPEAGVITNTGVAHLELLGSREAIAAAKGELLEMLPSDGVGVLNLDDEFFPYLAQRAPRTLSFGITADADVTGRVLSPWARGRGHGSSPAFPSVPLTPDPSPQTPDPALAGSLAATDLELWSRHFEVPPFTARVCSPGAHHLSNALAAVAVGLMYGLSPQLIARGLEAAEMSGMRMERVETPAGVVILNDAYNASPDSMMAALDVLEQCSGRRIAALGDMFELGHASEEAHRQVGERAARARVDVLVTVGDRATGIAEAAVQAGLPATRVIRCADAAEAAQTLRDCLRPGDTLLVKASRGMQLEQIVQELVDA